MTKYDLLKLYEKDNLTQRKLGDLLNKRYYEELAPLGYVKTAHDVSPKVVRRFFELYGEPINYNENEDNGIS